MTKINVFMLSTMVAGGLPREEGKIYALDEADALAVFKGHNGRAASVDDVARLGLTPDPARAADVGVVPSRPESVRKRRPVRGRATAEA